MIIIRTLNHLRIRKRKWLRHRQWFDSFICVNIINNPKWDVIRFATWLSRMVRNKMFSGACLSSDNKHGPTKLFYTFNNKRLMEMY